MISIHGFVFDNFLLSTMLPFLKRGDQSSANNYRAIAINILLGKISDTVILDTSSYQFDFEKARQLFCARR